jgi:hypothetical protein
MLDALIGRDSNSVCKHWRKLADIVDAWLMPDRQYDLVPMCFFTRESVQLLLGPRLPEKSFAQDHDTKI